MPNYRKKIGFLLWHWGSSYKPWELELKPAHISFLNNVNKFYTSHNPVLEILMQVLNAMQLSATQCLWSQLLLLLLCSAPHVICRKLCQEQEEFQPCLQNHTRTVSIPNLSGIDTVLLWFCKQGWNSFCSWHNLLLCSVPHVICRKLCQEQEEFQPCLQNHTRTVSMPYLSDKDTL